MFGLLIQYGSNYNLQDEHGNTPLHLSSMFNNYGGCTLLINLKKINFLVKLDIFFKYFKYSYFAKARR